MRLSLSSQPLKLLPSLAYPTFSIFFMILGLGKMWSPWGVIAASLGFFVTGTLLLRKIVDEYSPLTSLLAYYMFSFAVMMTFYLPAFVGERNVRYAGISFLMYVIIVPFIDRLLNEHNIFNKFEYDEKVFAGVWSIYAISSAVLTSTGLADCHHFIDFLVVIVYALMAGWFSPETLSGKARSAMTIGLLIFVILPVHLLTGTINPTLNYPTLHCGEVWIMSFIVCFSMLTSRCGLDIMKEFPKREVSRIYVDVPVKRTIKIEGVSKRLTEGETIVEKTIELKKMRLIDAYYYCISWLHDKKANIVSIQKPDYIQAFQSGTRLNLAREKIITIHLEENDDNVSIRVALSIPFKKVLLSKNKEKLLYLEELQKQRKKEWPILVKDLEKYVSKVRIHIKPRETNVLRNTWDAFKNLNTPRPPLTSVSEVVYEKMPLLSKTKSWGIVIISIALFLGFYLFYFWFAPSHLISNIFYFVATYGVAAFFLYWVHVNDRYEKEPWRLVIFLFIWGVFSGIIAAPLNRQLGPYFEIFGTRALVAAFVEEPVKALGLYLLLSHKTYGKELNSPMDGIVYGFAVGIGFFAMENFFYFLEYGFEDLVVRSLLCWGHGVYTATTGLWLAIARIIRGKTRVVDILPGLFVAIFLHFLWNGWGAWFGLLGEEFLELAGQIIFVQAVLQMVYLFRVIEEAIRDETLWGYTIGKAPVENG